MGTDTATYRARTGSFAASLQPRRSHHSERYESEKGMFAIHVDDAVAVMFSVFLLRGIVCDEPGVSASRPCRARLPRPAAKAGVLMVVLFTSLLVACALKPSHTPSANLDYTQRLLLSGDIAENPGPGTGVETRTDSRHLTCSTTDIAADITMQMDHDVTGPFCFLDGNRTTLTARQTVLTGTLGTEPVKKDEISRWKVKVSAEPNPRILQHRSLCELGLTTREAFESHKGREGWLSLTRTDCDKPEHFDHFTVQLSLQANNEIHAGVFRKEHNEATMTMAYQGGQLTCTLAFEVDRTRGRLNIDILVGDNGDRKHWAVKIDTPETQDLWPVFLVGHNNGALVSLTLLNSPEDD